jgi:hypothetical protein
MNVHFSSLGLIIWILVIGWIYRKMILDHSGIRDRDVSSREESQPERPMFENIVFRRIRRQRERDQIKVTRH